MGWIVGFKRKHMTVNEYVASLDSNYTGMPGSHTTSRRKAMIFPTMEQAIHLMARSPFSSTIMFIEEQNEYEGR